MIKIRIVNWLYTVLFWGLGVDRMFCIGYNGMPEA